MPKIITYSILLLVIAVSCFACASKASTNGSAATLGSSQQPNAQTPQTPGELKSKVPDGWVTEQPSSAMRKAQYKLPKVDGDSEDGELVLYFFGTGQGGTVQANIDRWVDQMQQADGSASKDKAKIETLTINGLKVTTVDISGTYTAQMSPGSDKHYNNSNSRLRAAVIETPKGNYFAKLIGPEKTVAHWDQSFNEYVKSLEFK
jgi:hypothetical protein